MKWDLVLLVTTWPISTEDPQWLQHSVVHLQTTVSLLKIRMDVLKYQPYVSDTDWYFIEEISCTFDSHLSMNFA